MQVMEQITMGHRKHLEEAVNALAGWVICDLGGVDHQAPNPNLPRWRRPLGRHLVGLP